MSIGGKRNPGGINYLHDGTPVIYNVGRAKMGLRKLIWAKPQFLVVHEDFDSFTEQEKADYMEDLVGSVEWKFCSYFDIKE